MTYIFTSYIKIKQNFHTYKRMEFAKLSHWTAQVTLHHVTVAVNSDTVNMHTFPVVQGKNK